MDAIKIVVVGDGGVGKTCLLMSFTTGQFPTEYIPTIFDNYESVVRAREKDVKVSLWDTAGQEGYARIRCLSYPHTNVFLLCYSIEEPSSFVNVTNRWIPELSKYKPDAPIILVGLRSDVRANADRISQLREKGYDLISYEEAERCAKSISAAAYVECSALTRTNVKNVFEMAIDTAVKDITKQ